MKKMILLAVLLVMALSACGQTASDSLPDGIKVNAGDGITVQKVTYQKTDDIVNMEIEWTGN